MNWAFLLHLIRVVSESTGETVYMNYICSIHYSVLSVCLLRTTFASEIKNTYRYL